MRSFVAILDNIRSGFGEIWAHKMRSALTLTGIILGVLSINVMFSLVGGVRGAINEAFQAVGLEGVVFVSPRRIPKNERTALTSASKGITVDDVDAINASIDGVTAVALTQFNRQVDVGGGEQVTVQIMGTGGAFLDMRNLSVVRGRTLVPADEDGETPVAVLGGKVARDIFGVRDPLGQMFPVGNLRFLVVGLLEHQSLPPGVHMGGLDTEGNTVYIPANTARRYMVGMQTPVGLAVYVQDISKLPEKVDEIEALLYRRHRGVEDFEVENVAEELLRGRKEVEEMLGNFNIVLGCIAGTALLVGGIGILSIMLIAIQERLFEIGIRKAVGARDMEILVQFLVESVVLSGVGAAVGSAAAWGIVAVAGKFVPTGLDLSLGGLSLSYSFAMIVGVGFGLYPAWIASRKEPVEALRAS